MSIKNIDVLSASAKKWIIASYIFEAKMKIDSLSYIAKHHTKIPVGALQYMIKPLYLDFFIECTAAIDNYIIEISSNKKDERLKRKSLQDADADIKEIYYWRNKFAAHHDLDALGFGLCGSFFDWKKHIENMKCLLSKTFDVCKDNLPENFEVDYVVHDAVAFRLVNRIDRTKEKELFKAQHPFAQGDNVSENGGESYKVISSVDDVCRHLRIMNSSRNVLVKQENVCIVIEAGVCREEGLQKRQMSCIIANILYDENMWVSQGETWDDKLLESINKSLIKRVTKGDSLND